MERSCEVLRRPRKEQWHCCTSFYYARIAPEGKAVQTNDNPACPQSSSSRCGGRGLRLQALANLVVGEALGGALGALIDALYDFVAARNPVALEPENHIGF